MTQHEVLHADGMTIRDHRDLLVAVGARYGDTVEQDERRLRLLSAAPDLIAVVRSYLDLDEMFASGADEEQGLDDGCLWGACRDMAEAALAKAQGSETPEQRGRLALLLAGPELLEALEGIAAYWEGIVEYGGGFLSQEHTLNADESELLAAVGTVIARATDQPAEVQP